MKCPKCGGEFLPPDYCSAYKGWPWNLKLAEWLSYKCTACSYHLYTACKDDKGN